MKPEELTIRVMAAARAFPPADSVPYAFEKRVMANLRDQPGTDLGTLWTRMLWRAAVPCVAIMLMVSVWTYLIQNSTGNPNTFATELENVVFAPMAALEESW
jgi:hypothetical protein